MTSALSKGEFPAKGPLLIDGLTLLSPESVPLRQGAIAIDARGRIADVGPEDAVKEKHRHSPKVSGAGFLAIPGLVNAHTHSAMGFFRGLGHGKSAMIETFLFPAEKSLTAELTEPLSYSYLVQGLKAGMTAFGDHYYFVDGVARAADRLGLRGAVGETVCDLGGAFPGRAGLDRALKSIDKWPHSSRVTPVIAPHAADTVSPALLKELAEVAKARNLPIHMHLAQSSGERERVTNLYGKSPVALADECGVLSQATLAVHMIAANDADLGILARRAVTVGACPASQIIYESLAPLKGLCERKIPLALGTDCAASNDGADLLQEMKLLALLLKDRGAPEEHYAPVKILGAATVNGARALGIGHEVGTLTAGKAADICFLELGISSEPMERPDVNLIYSLGARAVRHVMVDGRFVLKHGELTLASEAALAEDYRRAVAEIKRRIAKGS